MYREFFTRNIFAAPSSRSEERDGALKSGEYRIAVRGDGAVRIRYSDGEGLRYAEETLARLADGEGRLPVCELADGPSFPMRGIIEGFYGAPYTPAQRRDLIDFLAAHRMNAYLYAPKDDLYHREKWREPYPEKELAALRGLIAYAKERGVRFYFCLSPGIDFRYTDEGDYAALAAKFGQLTACGAEEFAVLFDDIPPSLTEEEAKRFSSPAEAHCHVANFIDRTVPHRHELLFCPTDYSQIGDTPYRAAVRAFLAPGISVFWTGYNTIAEVIPEEDCARARAAFGHSLTLWDNYPVNDFEPKRRIYLGELENRTKNAEGYFSGCVFNPSELWEASKLALATAAEWAWNCTSYDGEGAFRRAVKEYLGDSEEALFFAELSRSSVMREFPCRAPLFEKEDFSALDRSFSMQRRAVKKLRAICPPALAAEIGELFRYAEAECGLYRAFRAGKPLGTHLARMEKCRYRTADTSLLRYLCGKGLAHGCVPAERETRWGTETTE